MFAEPTSNNNEFEKYDEPRLHWERLMRVRLVEFDISLRILLLLESGGVKTLGDLVKHNRHSLRQISQIGELTVKRLEDFLAELGLSLAK